MKRLNLKDQLPTHVADRYQRAMDESVAIGGSADEIAFRIFRHGMMYDNEMLAHARGEKWVPPKALKTLRGIYQPR